MTDGMLQRLSPSALGQIRSCGYSRFLAISGSRGGPGASNPWARLGDSSHAVLEWAALEAPTLVNAEDLEGLIRQRWSKEVEAQEIESRRHSSEVGYGPAADWPSVAITEERTVIEAERLVQEVAAIPPERCKPEWTLNSEPNRIHGKIDLCLIDSDGGAKVIDFKTGNVTADDVEPGGVYWLQIMLYAALVRAEGLEPTAGEVRPIGRPPVLIDVTDEAIDSALAMSHEALAEYNQSIAAGTPTDLARCSEEACGWCAFTLGCEEYWTAPDELGEIKLIEGVVISVDHSLVGKTALTIEADRGSRAGPTVVAGLHPSSLPNLNDTAVGHRVRIAGLRESGPDSSTLVATFRTRFQLQP